MIFRPVAEIRGSEQFWQHTFDLKIPRFMPGDFRMPSCAETTVRSRNDNITCTALANVESELRSLHTECIQGIRDNIYVIQKLIPEINDEVTSTRSKRALINFGGDVLHSLFGVARSKDLLVLQGHVKTLATYLENTRSEFLEHESEMASIMATVDERLVDAARAITANHAELEELSSAVDNELRELNEIWRSSLLIVSSYRDKVTKIQMRMLEVMSGINELTYSRLSPYLVPTDLLRKALDQVQSVLMDRHPNFYVVHKDSAFYYQHTVSTVYRYKDSILITIDIPVVAGYHKYLVHEVLSVPVPIDDSKNHSTIALGLPDYIGLDLHSNSYVELQSKQYDQCLGKWEKHCPTMLTERSTSYPSCALAILFQLKDTVLEKCDFGFQQDEVGPSLFEVSPGNLLVSNINSLVLDCQGMIKTQDACQYCVITVPCSCSISADPFLIPERIDSCDKTSQVVSKTHLVNLALLQNFFSKDKLEDVMGDTTFAHPVETVLPEFKLFSHNLSNLLVTENGKHLSLKSMIDKVKQNATIYSSASDAILGGEWLDENDFDWFSTQNILSFVSISLSIVIGSLLLALTAKFRKLSMTVLALKAIHSAEAVKEVKSFIYVGEDPDSLSTSMPECVCDFKIEAIYGIISVCGLTFVIFLIYFCKHWSSSHTVISLELTTGTLCVEFPLLKLKSCPKYLHFKASQQFDNMSIKGGFAKRLTCDWHHLKISSFCGKLTHFPPEYFELSWWSYGKVKTILQSDFCAFLKVTHNKTSTYVSRFCEPGCTNATCEFGPSALLFKIDATGEA